MNRATSVPNFVLRLVSERDLSRICNLTVEKNCQNPQEGVTVKNRCRG